MDASAIIQNDATVENMRALTEATLEYGVYPRGHATISDTAISDKANLPQAAIGSGQAESFVTQSPGRRPPGICVPWTQAARDIPRIRGDEGICRDVWQRIDAMANMYVWCVFLVF